MNKKKYYDEEEKILKILDNMTVDEVDTIVDRIASYLRLERKKNTVEEILNEEYHQNTLSRG